MKADVRGALIHYESFGTGSPMLIVHGGMGRGHGGLRPWLDPLGAFRRLVYVDLPGDGRSEAPAGHGEWATLEPLVDALHELRQKLGIERWTLFGHSFGGFVVQSYAIEHPEYLDGLIVCCSSPVLDHYEQSLAAARRHASPEQLAAIADRLFVPKADDAEFERVWNEVFPVYFAHPERIDFAGLPKTPFTSAAFNATLRILPNADVLARLPEITVPTLVIGAAQDWTFPPPVGASRIHERIAGSDYVEFAESGHYPFIEEHELFVATVGDWLLAHPPAGEPMSALVARQLLDGVGLAVPPSDFPTVVGGLAGARATAALLHATHGLGEPAMPVLPATGQER